MLGKLKIFSSKDKSTECPKTQLSKRTSSSSGFSSARSERSDSSLSLNNETSSNIPTSQSSSSNKSTSTKKSDASTKVTTKISKVPAPATALKKGDKRDKAQLNNNNNQTAECNNDGDISPTKAHKIPQAKLQVPVGRKSADSKTGLQPQQAKSMQSPSVGTGIPKPMAAIKGTTKQILEVSSDEHFDVIKVEKVSVSMVPNNNNNDGGVQKTQIVNPLHNQLLNQTNNNMLSESSMESAIYRSNGTETSLHSDIYQLQAGSISNRKLENFGDPFNGNKFGTMPTKVNGVQTSSLATTIIEEDKEVTSTMVPMRPLMRGGFNNHMSSPSRLNRVAVTGYYDENGQGYCSDGDSFRNASIRYSDIENGYLSEGPHFLSILRNRPQMPSTIAEER